jgi:hypothetical protein
LSPLAVADIVQTVHAKFEGRPVRDFVPLLVERNAKAELAKLGGTALAMASSEVRVHVDNRPEDNPLSFEETNGEPIISYRSMCSTGLEDANGNPLPDGWVLYYMTANNGVKEQLLGNRFREEVDEAVVDAKEYFRRDRS